MPKRKTTEEFIADAIKIHKDKYGYDRVDYKNFNEKVEIYCKVCTEYFKQTPREHLDGCGCPTCGRNRLKSKLYGVGINDLEEPISHNGKLFKFYVIWQAMLYRCYNKKFQEKEKTYIGCSVCDEWLHLSNFKRWFDENYVEGFELDKDFIGQGFKLYSPDTCCFVPKEINALTTNKKKNKSKFGTGVYKKGSSFYSTMNKNKTNVFIGLFSNERDARNAYIAERRRYINEIADSYYSRGEINKRVYNAIRAYANKEDC